MVTTTTRTSIEQKAERMGFGVHESVTDERLARINPRMLNGRPDRLTKKNVRWLDVSREQGDQWISEGCHIASYDLGQPGDEVIAPPIADKQLALVILPSFRVVAVVEGQGESTDGDNTNACGMMYTILR